MRVLVDEVGTSPSEWPIGEVIAVHPGPDAIVRNVDILVRDRVLSRPIQRLRTLEAEMD
jgi:hypothetical protein